MIFCYFIFFLNSKELKSKYTDARTKKRTVLESASNSEESGRYFQILSYFS